MQDRREALISLNTGKTPCPRAMPHARGKHRERRRSPKLRRSACLSAPNHPGDVGPKPPTSGHRRACWCTNVTASSLTHRPTSRSRRQQPGTDRREPWGGDPRLQATGSPVGRRTGWRKTCSSMAATSRRTPGTTPTETGLPTAGALLRRRGDQALRGCALPAARAGLRGVASPRRDLPLVADLLRADGAVLHAGRAALSGPRCPR